MTNGWIWSKKWVTAWVVVTIVVPPLAFILPLFWWAVLAAGTFGPMEAFAIWHGRRWLDPRFAPYPPLTYVVVYGTPGLWLTYAYTGWVLGTVGTMWLFPNPSPWKAGAALALGFWLVEHWRSTALEKPRPQ